MAKYLLKVNYTSQGTKGLLKDGGSGRRAAVKQVVEGLGGKVEAWYYALGETDLFVILDLPDAQTAAAFSLVVHAAGAAQISTIPLLTVEEIDAHARSRSPTAHRGRRRLRGLSRALSDFSLACGPAEPGCAETRLRGHASGAGHYSTRAPDPFTTCAYLAASR